MDHLEAAQTLGSDRFRLGRVANTWLGVLGIGGKNPDVDNAISALRRFKTEQGMKSVSVNSEEKDTFRRDMRAVVDAVRNGEDPSEKIKTAIDSGKGHSISESLRSRRVLYDGGKEFSPEQMTALENRIGKPAVETLKAYDDNLSVFSSFYDKPSLYANLGLTEQAKNLVMTPDQTRLKQMQEKEEKLRAFKELKDENLRRQRSSSNSPAASH
jgi:ATP-dependent helicase/DNAse subunit B